MNPRVLLVRHPIRPIWNQQLNTEGSRIYVACEHSRNMFIADLANDLFQDPRGLIKYLGLERKTLVPYRPQHIAMFVRSLEHASEIAKLCECWRIQDPENLHDDLPDEDFGTDVCSAIIMPLANQALADTNADIIIRATGGHGLLSDIPQIKIRGQKRRKPRLIIDIADYFGDRPMADTALRIEEYKMEQRAVGFSMPYRAASYHARIS